MFSNTVMCGNSARFWNTMPRWRSPGSRSLTTRSPMITWPLVGCSRPQIMFSVVVLPQPEGPTKIMNSPSRISRLTPATAVTLAPNVFTRFSSTMRATLIPPRRFSRVITFVLSSVIRQGQSESARSQTRIATRFPARVDTTIGGMLLYHDQFAMTAHKERWVMKKRVRGGQKSRRLGLPGVAAIGQRRGTGNV